jgi:gamma-glutamyl hydrolase
MIGVLTQPIDSDMRKAHPALQNKTSYIMASYIYALEQSGARTVPLIFDNPYSDEELKKLDHLNGVFYCGGDISDDYNTFGRKVYDKAKAMNDLGNPFPVWGTCLGFQMLAMYAASSGSAVLSENAFDSNDANYNLDFTVPPGETRLFSPLKHLAQNLADKNLTYNHHHDGVTPDKFESDEGLKAMFR